MHISFGSFVLNVNRLVIVSVITLAAAQAAGQTSSSQDVEFRIARMSAEAGGVYAYVSDEWGLLRLNLTNHQQTPVELLCTTYFEDEPTLQYGRRVWLPARSRMQSWHPIRIPKLLDPKQNRVETHTLVTEAQDGSEVLLRDDLGKMRLSGLLPVVRQPSVTGFIGALDSRPPTATGEVSPFDFVMTGRLCAGQSRSISILGDRGLPPVIQGLQALDQLVVADDRLLQDAASLQAVRQWLNEGGRLWIMLDRTGPELLDGLLGDMSSSGVVDTVTHTSIDLSAGPTGRHIEPSSREFEQPVTLVRTLVSEGEVPIVANGWPAAYWQEFGSGRLLVTTLESTGWLQPEDDVHARRVENSTGLWSLPAFQILMDSFFITPTEERPIVSLLEPHVREFIGYSIPSRTLVLTMLGGFVGLFAAIGIWLFGKDRLEQLALVGPALAVVTASGLVVAGWRQRDAVPDTMAMLQVVHPVPGNDEIQVSGHAGLYSQDAGTLTLAGDRGGWMIPQMEGAAGTTRRLIWTDINNWSWENVPQVPGIQPADFQVPLETAEPIVARALFGSQGLTGQLTLPDSLQAADAVLGTRRGRIGVDLLADGQFESRTDQVLGKDQYLQGALLSDEQARRSRILAQVLAQSGDEPKLYVWNNLWDIGLQLDDDVRRLGEALTVLPVEFQRPPTGTVVSLPSPLLAYRGAIGPDGLQLSGLYDYRSHRWSRKAWPSATWLRFQIPPVLLPLKVSSARIDLQVTGPVGNLELATVHDDEIIPLTTWIDPVGAMSFEVAKADLPDITPDGGLLLRIAGGDPDRPELTNAEPGGSQKVSYWEIESLDLQLEAVITDDADTVTNGVVEAIDDTSSD